MVGKTMNEQSSKVNFGLGPILQSELPDVPWTRPHTRKLPGIEPLDENDWLRVDSAFSGQMALRDLLADQKNEAVVACLPEAEDAAHELLGAVLSYLSSQDGYEVFQDRVRRPDGVVVPIGDPMNTLMRLVAEDFCILQKQEDEHVLVAASLGFPAGWTLAQKLGKPLVRIHRPVKSYDADISKRVQRMFDGIRSGKGLVRMNAHRTVACELFRAIDEDAPYDNDNERARPFIRTERQCLTRLPQTNAVVFSIQTRIVVDSALTPRQLSDLASFPIGQESRIG